MKRFWHGFRKREPVKQHEKSPASFLIPPELAGLAVSIITKVIGSTVKDRLLRAILTAIIAGLGAWFGFSPSESSPEYSQPNTAAIQQRNAPVVPTPGSPGMATPH
jgi:hypothetical protein